MNSGGCQLTPGADTGHWFEPIAAHLGSAYLRYSFTKGTEQEIAHLVDALELDRHTRVLDVGCGPGRHAHALARREIPVHGVDISREFIALAEADAPAGATFAQADARTLAVDEPFDRAICLCQGAFGLMVEPGGDEAVLASIARSLVPGGLIALSAFNAYFAVRFFESADFDAASGICHERTVVRDPAGRSLDVDLWTGCYTPRELELLLERHGFRVRSISGVEPGRYGWEPPSVEHPEYLVIAELTPGSSPS